MSPASQTQWLNSASAFPSLPRVCMEHPAVRVGTCLHYIFLVYHFNI